MKKLICEKHACKFSSANIKNYSMKTFLLAWISHMKVFRLVNRNKFVDFKVIDGSFKVRRKVNRMLNVPI